MVEINIEKKKKPMWPWILLLVIVALLVWAIYELTSDRDTADTAALPVPGMLLAAGPTEHYTHQPLT
jgi:hypothetical protein